MGGVIDDCGLRFVQMWQRGSAPLKKKTIWGSNGFFSKYYQKKTPTEIIPSRRTKEPNFAVACLIHLLTQRLRNLVLKTRRGLVISFFTNVQKKSAQRPYDE